MHYQSSWEKLLSHQTLLKQDKKTQLFKLGRLGKQSQNPRPPSPLCKFLLSARSSGLSPEKQNNNVYLAEIPKYQRQCSMKHLAQCLWIFCCCYYNFQRGRQRWGLLKHQKAQQNKSLNSCVEKNKKQKYPMTMIDCWDNKL